MNDRSAPESPSKDGVKRELKRLRATLDELQQRGDAAAVEREIASALARYPEDPRVYTLAAEFFERSENPERAAAAYQQLLDLSPTWKARSRLAAALGKAGRHADAHTVYRPVPSERPSARTFTRLAHFAHRAGYEDEALNALRMAVKLNPRYEPATTELFSLLERDDANEEADELRDRLSALPPKRSAAEIVDRIARASDVARYAVNIGCRDGRSWGDPCYALYERGYAGLAVDAGDFPEIHRNLPQASVRKLLSTAVTPMNACELLVREGCPTKPVLVSIDIDSYDGAVLQAILDQFAPEAIHVEINPEIPPPVKFALQYDPRVKHSGAGGFFGCSLSFATAVARPYGYQLVQIDLGDPPQRQDIVLVREEHVPLCGVEPPGDERELFLREPIAYGSFWASGVDSVSWREREDYHGLLGDIWNACVAASLKRSGEVLPFSLSL